MYDRILVAIDGSEASTRALDEAVRLAENQNARLRLVHVVDTSCLYRGEEVERSVELEEAWRKTGQEVLDRGRALTRGSSITVETALHCTGSARVCETIVEDALKWAADLIVMGTHGRRGLNRLLLGSVAEGVTRMSSISVLLVLGRKGGTQPAAG
jgi:nucleotide-binding universal stress UspA family protein